MKTLLLTLALIGARGADAYFTDRNINHQPANWRGYETNPLQKPFVHGSAWLWSSQALQTAVTIEGAHLLRKHNHDHLADGLLIGDTALHVEGAIQSYKGLPHRNPLAN